MLALDRFHMGGICTTTTYNATATSTPIAPTCVLIAQMTKPATTIQPRTIIQIDGNPIGGEGTQRSQSHGPPTRDGTSALLIERHTSCTVCDTECVPAVASETEK